MVGLSKIVTLLTTAMVVLCLIGVASPAFAQYGGKGIANMGANANANVGMSKSMPYANSGGMAKGANVAANTGGMGKGMPMSNAGGMGKGMPMSNAGGMGKGLANAGGMGKGMPQSTNMGANAANAGGMGKGMGKGDMGYGGDMSGGY